MSTKSWKFRYLICNRCPQPKYCENEGCYARAKNIVGDKTANYYACSKCTRLIPGGKILKVMKLKDQE